MTTAVVGATASAPRPRFWRSPAADVFIGLALALLLRVPALGAWPLWIDEAATAAFAELPWDAFFGPILKLETTPPAYYALVKIWCGLFDASDGALRLLSALAGAASVVPVVLVCRSAFGPRAGLWGGILVALSAPHLHYSREARVYPLLFLAFACGLLFAQRLAAAPWQGPERWRWAGALAAACAAAMLLHNTGALAAASLFVYAGAVLLAERRLSFGASLPFLAAGSAALAAAAPSLLAAAALARDPANAASWMRVPGPDEVLGEFALLLLAPTQAVHLLPLAFVLPIAALGAAAMAFALFGRFRWNGRDPQAIGMAAALLFSAAAFFGVSQAAPVLLERTILFSLALFLPLAATSLAALGAGPWRRAVLAAALAPHLLAAVVLHRAPGKGEDWPGVAAHLAREGGAGEPILVLGAFETVALERYAAPEPALGPLVTVVPAFGSRLQFAVVAAMTRAVPRPVTATMEELCGPLGEASTLWVLSRWTIATEPVRLRVTETLRRGGATPAAAALRFGRLVAERWAVPGCGAGR